MSKTAPHTALVYPVQTKPWFAGVVMPYKPRIDKIAGYELLQGHNTKPFETISTWPYENATDEQFAKWRNESLYPIDVADRKYHKIDLPSASEFVVRHFDIERTPGVVRLLELVARNNRDGSLKRGKYRIPRLLQDAYELSDSDEHHAAVIVQAAHAARCFIRTTDGEIVREEDGLNETFPDLVSQFEVCQYAPLSLGRYLRDQWVLGLDVAEIVQNIEYWTNIDASVNRRKQEAVEAFNAYPRTGEFMAGGKKGIVLKTDDPFFVQAADATNEYVFRVVVGSKGHVTVKAQRIDLSGIAQKLQEMEPDRWYYQPVMYSLINGGVQYGGIAPTKLSYVVIVDLIQEAFGRPRYDKPRRG